MQVKDIWFGRIEEYRKGFYSGISKLGLLVAPHEVVLARLITDAACCTPANGFMHCDVREKE